MATLPPVVQIKVRGTAQSHSHSDISAASHRLVVDEPLALGGTNLGPTPLQTLMASWVGCVTIILGYIAQQRGIQLQGLVIEAEATLNTAGVRLVQEVNVPITAATLRLQTTSRPSTAEREALLIDLQRFCPISKVLRAAGASLNINWNENSRADSYLQNSAD